MTIQIKHIPNRHITLYLSPGNVETLLLLFVRIFDKSQRNWLMTCAIVDMWFVVCFHKNFVTVFIRSDKHNNGTIIYFFFQSEFPWWHSYDEKSNAITPIFKAHYLRSVMPTLSSYCNHIIQSNEFLIAVFELASYVIIFDWQSSSHDNINWTRWTLLILPYTESYFLSARMCHALLWVCLTSADL